MNLTDFDIAAKSQFGNTNAPISINFTFDDQSSYVMMGNFAFTNQWAGWREAHILKANSTDILPMESINSFDFGSKEYSQEFIEAGGCKRFANVVSVDILGSVSLDVMRRGTTEWVPITSVMEVAIF